MEPVRAELDGRAHPAEIPRVREAFASAGIPADVSRAKWVAGGQWTEGAGGDEPEWVIAIILAYPVLRFLDGFVGAAGADAWEALKRLMNRLGEARRSEPPYQGSIRIREPSGREVVVSMIPKPPFDDAWRTIFELDWDSLPKDGPLTVQWFERAWVAFGEEVSLYWDREARKWRDWDGGLPVPAQSRTSRWGERLRRLRRR